MLSPEVRVRSMSQELVTGKLTLVTAGCDESRSANLVCNNSQRKHLSRYPRVFD